LSVNVCITNELARAAGRIAGLHPESSIEVEWRETSDEREWFVTATNGVHSVVYVVDDESGVHAPLTEEELARYNAGLTVLGDERFERSVA
jgi:hypothetical protein